VKSSQLRELTKEEIVQKRLEIEEELFNLRLQKKLKELDNPLRLRTLRREIAKIKTILREDQLKIRPLVNAREEKKE